MMLILFALGSLALFLVIFLNIEGTDTKTNSLLRSEKKSGRNSVPRNLQRFGEDDDDESTMETIVVIGRRHREHVWWSPSPPMIQPIVQTYPFGVGEGGGAPSDNNEDENEEEQDACDEVMDDNNFDSDGFTDTILSGGAYGIPEEASNAARSNYPSSQFCHNDECDAFRHAYGMFLLTQRFGSAYANFVGDAHERDGLQDGSPRGEVAMDLHNNRLGREIAEQNPGMSPEDGEQAVADAINNGDMETEPVDCDA